MNIISFNVGIELGQILALSAMLLLLAGWRKTESFKPFSMASNYALVFVGAYLFIMQMHGYEHTNNPDEFGFSADNHIHEHLRMNQPTNLDINPAPAGAASHHDSLD